MRAQRAEWSALPWTLDDERVDEPTSSPSGNIQSPVERASASGRFAKLPPGLAEALHCPVQTGPYVYNETINRGNFSCRDPVLRPDNPEISKHQRSAFALVAIQHVVAPLCSRISPSGSLKIVSFHHSGPAQRD